MLAKPLTLPAEALARLARMENLGDLHVALKPTAKWRRKAIQEQIETLLRSEFQRMGLLDNRGRVDGEIASSLAVVCRAGAEFYGWIKADGRTRGVLAAAIGREAVLAIRDGEDVTLNQIRPESLPMVLVAQLPEVPPAQGQQVSLLQSDLQTGASGRVRTEAGVGMRPAPPEVRMAQQIAQQPTVGGGELYVAVRDRLGRRKTVPQPLRYADTPTGRWLNYQTPTGDGGQRILLKPATQSELAGRLQEMHRALSG